MTFFHQTKITLNQKNTQSAVKISNLNHDLNFKNLFFKYLNVKQGKEKFKL